MNHYKGDIDIYHFDAFRLSSAEEILDIDCDAYFFSDGVSIVEWADKVTEALPEEYLEISFVFLNENCRKLNIFGKGEKYKFILTRIIHESIF